MGRGDLSVRVPVKGSGELRRLSETFNTMSEKLEMLEQSRNQFVSNASHGAENPAGYRKFFWKAHLHPTWTRACALSFSPISTRKSTG